MSTEEASSGTRRNQSPGAVSRRSLRGTRRFVTPYLLLVPASSSTRSSPSTRSTASSTSASTTGTSSPAPRIRSWAGRTTRRSSTTPSFEPRRSTRSSSSSSRCRSRWRSGSSPRRCSPITCPASMFWRRLRLHPGRHVVGRGQLGLLLHLRVPGRPHERHRRALRRSYGAASTGSLRPGPRTASSGCSASGRASAGRSSSFSRPSTAFLASSSSRRGSTAPMSSGSGGTWSSRRCAPRSLL